MKDDVLTEVLVLGLEVLINHISLNGKYLPREGRCGAPITRQWIILRGGVGFMISDQRLG